MATVKIPDYWTADDRSNVILRKGDTTLAWLHLDDGHWLFVSHATDFETVRECFDHGHTSRATGRIHPRAFRRMGCGKAEHQRRALSSPGAGGLVGSMDTGG